MTLDRLKDCNKQVLAKLARDHGVVGWHAMRKDQLIRALTPVPSETRAKAKPQTAQPQPGRSVAAAKPASAATNGRPAQNGAAPRPANGQRNGHGERNGKASTGKAAKAAAPAAPVAEPAAPRMLAHGCAKDRIIAMVRDSYWLHTYWELSRSTLSRAQAALGQEWHSARPILRVMDVSSEDTTSASERHIRDIEIHGGVNNWFIDVSDPPRSFRIDIGYLSRKGKFYVLSRSNVVTTPKAGATDMLDQNWLNLERDYERMAQQASSHNEQTTIHTALRELFEDRLKRPMNSLAMNNFGTGAFPSLGRKFHFEVGAELVVYGTTEPSARVTLQGEAVPVRPDGSFSVRFSLPDARQIIPAVATSADGVEERTVVLAVERNTKELEPMIHDGNDL